MILRQLALRRFWPRLERMVARGTVLVPHRSLLVTATDAARTRTPAAVPNGMHGNLRYVKSVGG